MKKSKGFMMAEVVVVSAIALVALGSLYASYAKLLGAYRTRISYNDMKSLNRLIFFRDTLIETCDALDENCKINLLIKNAKTTSSKKLQNITSDINGALIAANNDVKNGVLVSETTYFYYNKKANIPKDLLKNESVNITFKEYTNYLKDSVSLTDSNFVLLIERCYTKDNCNYAYLKVYDE